MCVDPVSEGTCLEPSLLLVSGRTSRVRRENPRLNLGLPCSPELFRNRSREGSGQVPSGVGDLNANDCPLLIVFESDVLVQFLAVSNGTTPDDQIEDVYIRVIVGSQLGLPCQHCRNQKRRGETPNEGPISLSSSF